jgi:hypothetical protein
MKRYYPIAVKTTESDILDHILHPIRRKIIFSCLHIASVNSKKLHTLYIELNPLHHFNSNLSNMQGLSLFSEAVIKRITSIS